VDPLSPMATREHPWAAPRRGLAWVPATSRDSTDTLPAAASGLTGCQHRLPVPPGSYGEMKPQERHHLFDNVTRGSAVVEQIERVHP
jgi:hypothetical protein